MAADMEKIIEISLAKIEHSRSRKVTGKSTTLHRNLLVNTLLNRVRTTDKSFQITEPLMNYREPRGIVDMDVDDYDMEKIPALRDCSSRVLSQHTQQTLNKKQSSLVTKLNTRSLSGKSDIICKDVSKQRNTLSKTKENMVISCECPKITTENKTTKKRSRPVELEDHSTPTKLRCLWPTNVSPKVQELSYSITSLASLFDDLVANADTESLGLGSNYVSAMVAC